jgi:hypothetical protein
MGKYSCWCEMINWKEITHPETIYWKNVHDRNHHLKDNKL